MAFVAISRPTLLPWELPRSAFVVKALQRKTTLFVTRARPPRSATFTALLLPAAAIIARVTWGTQRRRLSRSSLLVGLNASSIPNDSPPRYLGIAADASFQTADPSSATARSIFAEELTRRLVRGGTLPWEEAQLLVRDVTDLLASERSLVRVSLPPGSHINVCGDLHGQLFDVDFIFKKYGWPSPTNPFLFNGDFVDRGSYSVETLLILLAWKAAMPRHVYLARGNHESHEMNVMYGFFGEVLTKYGMMAYEAFQKLFLQLPLAHVLNENVFVVHGGLPRNSGAGLLDIDALDRLAAASPDMKDNLFMDLLWSDPCEHSGYRRSARGPNLARFGPDVTHRFLEANSLSLLIRSHEVKLEGFEWAHSRQCLTVFSAPNYLDTCRNKGAVARVTACQSSGRLECTVSTFEASPRPTEYVPAMAYSPMSHASKKYLSQDAQRIVGSIGSLT